MKDLRCCVQLLLSTPGIDANLVEKEGRTPLNLARDYEVLTMLQKYTTSCEDFPVHTYGKVIMCGDSGAGKTSLTKVRHIWCIDIITVYRVIADTVWNQGLLTLHGLETRIQRTYKTFSPCSFRLVPRPRRKTKPSLPFKEVCTCCTKLLWDLYVQICNNSVLCTVCTVCTLFAPIEIIIWHVAPLCAHAG